MNVSLLFLSGLAVTAMMSFGVVFYLQRPLRKLLGELCGNDDRRNSGRYFPTLLSRSSPWWRPSNINLRRRAPLQR